jgi:capsular polysaccharide biosynthesis protein
VSPALPLRILKEADVLEPAPLDALRDEPLPGRGRRAELEPAPPFDYGEAVRRLQARGAGPVRPDSIGPWKAAAVEVCRVADVHHLPRYGALVWPDGTAPFAPLGGPLEDPERLAQAPGFGRDGEDYSFTAPPAAPRLERAGVFMPWGGGFNYGHMLLDALPSLLALEEAGLLDAFPPIAPPLKRWQRELVALLQGDDAPAVREVADPVLRLGEAAYATSMDHYLHAPNALLDRMRQRLAARSGPAPLRARRIYLSRRSHANPMRICLNEAELERALAARGFAIVRPERLSPSEQIALARDAEVIVGPTGAGLSNALFAPPGALVIDIQPQIFPSAWTAAFGERTGHDWRIYYAPAPAPLAQTPWVRRARRGFRFAFRVPLEDFLCYLDEALA